ncbi:8594_t:CDS:2 [Scutellospora calospora]|uniref:8594_t:CDS:1 n=1 Tax=Scutellospora calospora TaxID=85575 RepID=A0ACA9K3A1_9GLOM|nr:8594_t:CDS:2 [Scutellospora calospora]
MLSLIFENPQLNLNAIITLLLIAIITFVFIKLFSDDKPIEFTVPVPIEAKPGWVDGKILEKLNIKDPQNPGYITCYDPATGQLLSNIRAHTEQDVINSLKKVRNAQKKWALTTFAERRKVLKSLLNFIVKNQDEICWVSCRDTGKSLVDAKFGEILATCERIQWIIKKGEKALSPQYHESSMLLLYKIAKVMFEPLGVVAALVSWNYPFHNLIGPIISALFAGNGIIIKSSEQVAWSLQYYSEIIKVCLISCGHDPDIVQFLCGFPECGEALVKSGVDGLTFIGSPQVGKQIMSSSSTTLTPCILELGGKDCAILRQDVNLNQVIPIILRGVFQNSGQNCVGLERILVHESIYDEFVKIVEQKIKELRVGCALNDEEGVDVGALTMSDHLDRLSNLIKSTVSQGAKLLYGGYPFIHPLYPTAHYYTPTLLIDVTPEMPISKTEHFAPIMVVMKFRTDDEAIEIANASGYGLGNSVFTRDQRRGEWMVRRLRCGMVNVNDFGATYLCNLPFGGVGISGFGRFGGIEGLRQQCLMKSITLDRFPWLLQTSLPKILNYPISFGGSTFVSNLIKVVYENRLIDKLKGGIKLVIGESYKYE